jgi:hypothetical protein
MALGYRWAIYGQYLALATRFIFGARSKDCSRVSGPKLVMTVEPGLRVSKEAPVGGRVRSILSKPMANAGPSVSSAGACCLQLHGAPVGIFSVKQGRPRSLGPTAVGPVVFRPACRTLIDIVRAGRSACYY